MVQFAYAILYVKDVARTLHFYKQAFGLQTRFAAPDNSYGELITGSTTLSFASTTLAATNLPEGFVESTPGGKPFAMEIGITTDNVNDALKAALAAGASLTAAPKTKPWGQIVAYVRDPDGFLIEICTPVGG